MADKWIINVESIFKTMAHKVKMTVSFLYLTLLLLLCLCSSFSHDMFNGTAQQPDYASRAKSLRLLSARLGNNSKVILRWDNPKGMQVSYYTLQKSMDGIHFNDAALIFPPEKKVNFIKTYTFADKVNAFEDDVVYYRLKIEDEHGNFFFSDIAVVNLETQDNQFAVISNHPIRVTQIFS